MKMRPLRIFLWALAALALIGGTLIYYVNLKSADKQLAGIFDIGGPFSLTNQNGQAVSIYFSAPEYGPNQGKANISPHRVKRPHLHSARQKTLDD